MNLLTIESVWLIVDSLIRLRRSGLPSLLDRQRRQVVVRVTQRLSLKTLCDEIELACVLFPFPISPMARSASTARLLRRHGWPAELVLGVRIFPIDDYAWVEVDGAIVNDPHVMKEIYRVLERC